jgi:hypothetical protein
MNPLLRAALLFPIAALVLAVQASCARSVDSEVEPDPLLLSPDAKKLAPLVVCVETNCPAPWASCGDGLCTTDTSRDILHCGSCGIACPRPPKSHHATAVCANSRCAYACDELSADCNHLEGDGCEVFTGDDPKNCGGCGNVCKDGEICWKGACGCPSGFTQCGDDCKDLQTDNDSCGTCGKACVPPKSDDPEWLCGPAVQPPETVWGCTGGGCKLVCKPFNGNCDDNLCQNGCETDLRHDPMNCGTCGHQCAANQDCVDGTCICPPGTTRCGHRCVDVKVDPNNCGECGNGCPGAGGESENGTPTCSAGECGYLCYAGWANCDQRIENGCEVNIGSDPNHCGGCSTQCDAERSQPCVKGKCLTKPCEPGPGIF